MSRTIQPSFIPELSGNLSSSNQYVQVVLGPRQVGKTTGILNFLEASQCPFLYFTADDVPAASGAWIEAAWQEAVLSGETCILAIDEIQKVRDWSSTVKKLWDRQKRTRTKVQLILVGSSSLRLHEGLNESLAGRFQLVRAHHWDFARSRTLASMDVETFIRCGGYPGSYELLGNPEAWDKFIRDSIVETVIGKDILEISRIAKPALFRQAFQNLMAFPAQDVSYTKLLGQLQDRGNTDLIKHYIELYEGAYLLKTIPKYSGSMTTSRASSPKIIPLCGALIDRDVVDSNGGYGRAVEAAVGACLIQNEFKVQYWRNGDDEVDYVTRFERNLFAIEVKSGRRRGTKGMSVFMKRYPGAHAVYVSEATIESFLTDPRAYLRMMI